MSNATGVKSSSRQKEQNSKIAETWEKEAKEIKATSDFDGLKAKWENRWFVERRR